MHKDLVWNKGGVVPGFDPSIWRRDDFGNMIRFTDYGRHSDFGWEIDHIVPKSRGGSDLLSNLRPLFWRANASHGGRIGN